jgi:putative methyltransferase (TIGR04325 family)
LSTATLEFLHRAVERIGTLPGIDQWRRARYDQQFRSASEAHLFRGIYDSFDEAEADAPPGKPISYDNPQAARMYLRRLQADQYDYPAFFWLNRSFEQGMRSVFDVGGSVGIKYFAYGQLAPLPDNVRWLVQDMPAVAEEGRRFAAQRGATAQLHFTDCFADGSGCDVLYASGSLQYLPRTLASLLDELDVKPRRIVVNTAAIHPTKAYFTLNNIGAAFCAYRVQAREVFLREVQEAGYVLRDEWQNAAKPLRLPFTEGYDLQHYAGFCFDRAVTSASGSSSPSAALPRR